MNKKEIYIILIIFLSHIFNFSSFLTADDNASEIEDVMIDVELGVYC